MIIQTIQIICWIRQFVCSVDNCGKEYPNKNLYKRHLIRIHSDKTIRCDHLGCDYVTADKDYLSKHLKSHSDDRPFTCITDGCGKAFKRRIRKFIK